MARTRAVVVAGALMLCGSGLALSACGDDVSEVAFGGNCVWDLEELDPQEGDPEGSVRLAVNADCDYSDTGFGDLLAAGTAYISAPDGSGNATVTSDLLYTDEDGDEIEGTMAGTGSYGGVGRVFTFTGGENYGDGSGAFDGATGSADAEGELDLEGAVGTYAAAGVLDMVD
jgi:hypothetical protein